MDGALVGAGSLWPQMRELDTGVPLSTNETEFCALLCIFLLSISSFVCLMVLLLWC